MGEKKKQRKSVIPIYGIGVFWTLYGLLMPMYRPWHVALLAALTVPVYLLLSKLFNRALPVAVPGPAEEEAPAEPVSETGIPEHDALLQEGRTAVKELTRLQKRMTNPEIRAKVGRIVELTEQIFKDLKEDPEDYKMIRRFSDYFLPTTLKLLHEYDRMSDIRVPGMNVSSTKQRIEDILDTTILAYEKQLDALFANQALDIETDITVLESLLKQEGLASSDF
ncbi:MAG: 5-bromo-4-chloroindolyl phosphate hydrolysis family protein [Oscillospiraceae bacterium]|nr:5-bromo-4-chloroindolyl phosphate hydrolysis family protein [Oscillospiraceae bacterium]